VPPGTIRGIVTFARIAAAVRQQCVGERAKHRFGVLPANGIERAITVGNEDSLVADISKVTRAEPTEHFKDVLRPGRSGESGTSDIGCFDIPILHCFNEGRLRLVRGRNSRFANGAHRPITFTNITCLGTLEVIDAPEDRQPTIGIRRGHAGQVRRVHRQYRVEFETDRAGLHVAYTGEQQRSQGVAIAQTLLDPIRDFFQDAGAGGVFQQPDHRLDLRPHLDGIFGKLGFRCRYVSEFAEEGEFTGAQQGSSCRTPAEEVATVLTEIHAKSSLETHSGTILIFERKRPRRHDRRGFTV